MELKVKLGDSEFVAKTSDQQNEGEALAIFSQLQQFYTAAETQQSASGGQKQPQPASQPPPQQQQHN